MSFVAADGVIEIRHRYSQRVLHQHYGPDLRGARLRGLELIEADFDGDDLRGALFDDSVLRAASFVDAVLAECDLRGADLTDARLTGAVLRGAVYDENTAWPRGFDPEEAGARSASTLDREASHRPWWMFWRRSA